MKDFCNNNDFEMNNGLPTSWEEVNLKECTKGNTDDFCYENGRLWLLQMVDKYRKEEIVAFNKLLTLRDIYRKEESNKEGNSYYFFVKQHDNDMIINYDNRGLMPFNVKEINHPISMKDLEDKTNIPFSTSLEYGSVFSFRTEGMRNKFAYHFQQLIYNAGALTWLPDVSSF